MKISAVDHNKALALLDEPDGNTLADSVEVCKWLEEAGVDALHVSGGSTFPHPRNPAGADLDVKGLANTYEQLASSGANTFRNLLLFHNRSDGRALPQAVARRLPAQRISIEGLTLPDARGIKQAV